MLLKGVTVKLNGSVYFINNGAIGGLLTQLSEDSEYPQLDIMVASWYLWIPNREQ